MTVCGLRWLIGLPFLASWCSSLSAVEDAMPSIGQFGILKVRPEADLVWGDGQVRLFPKALVTGGWGYSQGPETEASRDLFTGVAIASEVWWSPIEEQRFSIEGVLTGAIENANRGREALSGIVTASWLRVSPIFRNEVQGSIGRDSYVIPASGLPVRTDRWQATWRGRISGAHLSFDFQPYLVRERYRQSDRGFPAEARGHVQSGVDGSASYTIGQSSVNGVVRYENYRFDQPGLMVDADVIRVAGGMSIPVRPALVMDTGIGVAQWSWGGDTKIESEGRMAFRWDYREGSHVIVSGERQAVLGITEEYCLIDRIQLDWVQRCGDRGSIRLVGGPGRGRHVQVEGDLRRFVQGELSYERYLDRGWYLKWYVDGIRSRSGIPGDYDRATLAMQVAVVY